MIEQNLYMITTSVTGMVNLLKNVTHVTGHKEGQKFFKKNIEKYNGLCIFKIQAKNIHL